VHPFFLRRRWLRGDWGFNLAQQAPWIYTQGDIRERVEGIRRASLDELSEDETTRKIAAGLANGLSPDVFVHALELLRDASMTTNVNERAHGYGARLMDDHKRYGFELVASRSTLNSCYPLFQPTGVQRKVDLLQLRIDQLDSRMPTRTSCTAMQFRGLARQRIADGFLEGQHKFDEMQDTMTRAAREWGGMNAAATIHLMSARDKHIEERTRLIADARKALVVKIETLQADNERGLKLRGLPNLLSAAEKFSDEELHELSALLQPDGADPGVPDAAMATAPEEPSVLEMNELERLNSELFPQEIARAERPWWVRYIATNRDEWYACAMFDLDTDGEKIYLMLFASQSPQNVTFLECREIARIIEVGGVASDGTDVPAAYREFEVLFPLVFVADHEVPFVEDTNIGWMT
jgi:hypothetical protein